MKLFSHLRHDLTKWSNKPKQFASFYRRIKLVYYSGKLSTLKLSQLSSCENYEVTQNVTITSNIYFINFNLQKTATWLQKTLSIIIRHLKLDNGSVVLATLFPFPRASLPFTIS